MKKIGQQIFNIGEKSEIPQDKVIFPRGEDKGIIYKLGIQAPIGTEFLISGRTIKIGLSGMYELDEEGLTINTLNIVTNGEKRPIIIDYIYDPVGGGK